MKISRKRLVEIIQEECEMMDDPHMGQEIDHEGAMAKRQLYDMERYSRELSQMLTDTTQLESWVQAKLTKAADYLKTVKHYVQYGMEEGAYDQVHGMEPVSTAVVSPEVGNIAPGDTIDDDYILKMLEELDK